MSATPSIVTFIACFSLCAFVSFPASEASSAYGNDLAWIRNYLNNEHQAYLKNEVDGSRSERNILIADKSVDASNLIERAAKAYSDKKYEEALSWLHTVLASDSSNAKAHNLLGLIYHRMQKPNLSESEYRKAVQANPKLVEAKYNLGIALFDQKKFKEAERYLEEAADKQRSSEYTYNLGLCYERLGKADKALSAYDKAIDLDKNNAYAHYSRGRVLFNDKKIPDAITEYKRALEIDPNYADAHNNLGVAYSEQGQYPESIEEFQLALKANPELPQAQQNLGFARAHTTLGMTYFKQANFDKAFEEYKKAITIDPYDADIYYNLALLYQHKDNVKAAIDHYRFAIKLAPSNAKAHNNLGVAYTQVGKKDLAETEFRQALKLNPGYSEAEKNLAALLQSSGRN